MSIVKAFGRLSCIMLITLLSTPNIAFARPQNATLTAETYQQRCLLCHKSSAPEGIAEEILVGLRTKPGQKAEDLMPGVECWRRCENCWPKPPSSHKK